MSEADRSTGERAGCRPCRGTGRLISGLGGVQHEVSCPWCEATGRFIPGHDAQERAAHTRERRTNV